MTNLPLSDSSAFGLSPSGEIGMVVRSTCSDILNGENSTKGIDSA